MSITSLEWLIILKNTDPLTYWLWYQLIKNDSAEDYRIIRATYNKPYLGGLKNNDDLDKENP